MPQPATVYLDHAATTPVLPAAREAMLQAMEIWANPSSAHRHGRAAKAALEDARRRIAVALNWEGEVIFTSGASESIRLAMTCDDPLFASAVEHDAVLACLGNGREIAVSPDGRIDLSAISGPGRYVIQPVNSETGVMQDMDALAREIRAARGVWVADCAQSAGKLPLPEADIIIVAGHKLGGPPGVGALLLRDLALLTATGGHEQGYRRGTENLPAIMGFCAALENGYEWMAQAEQLRSKLDAAIIAAGGVIIAEHAPRIATIASYRMPGISANSQMIAMDMAGIAVSAGSACSSGTLKTSRVLRAMGMPDKTAGEVIRVSFGSQTQQSDIERFVDVWSQIKSTAKAA